MSGLVAAPQVQIRRLRTDAVLPRYMSEAAAGMDLAAAIDRAIEIAPGERRAIGTGLALALPVGYEGQVRPRSGLARSRGVTVANAPGTIDADYRGEVAVLLINLGAEPAVIEPGQRIAQLVVAPVARAEVVEVDALPDSARGDGGFGSTGPGGAAGGERAGGADRSGDGGGGGPKTWPKPKGG